MKQEIEIIKSKLAKLILSTPSGSTRNELTNISILFENLINN